MDEVEKLRLRYARRRQTPAAPSYGPLDPAVYMALQEKERALIRWITWSGLAPVWDKRVLEIGCGTGENLLQLMRLGFRPDHLVGNELSTERVLIARSRLPSAILVLEGDASVLDLPQESFDVVLQSTVFSSILDTSFQHELAQRMWSLVKPGGGILWYDFTYDNPRNADVRGVPAQRIRDLFPHAEVKQWRLTLAPPISRVVTRIHPSFYTLFNVFPLLRAHVLCWITRTR